MVLSSYSSYTAGNQEKQPRRPAESYGLGSRNGRNSFRPLPELRQNPLNENPSKIITHHPGFWIPANIALFGG